MTTWRRIDTVSRLLELCDVRVGEPVAVVAEGGTDPELVLVWSLALERAGAPGAVVTLPGAPTDTDAIDTPVVAAAVRAARLVVDLTGQLSASPVVHDVLTEGRVLDVAIGDAATLDGLVAHPGLLRRATTAMELLARGGSLVVSSDAGTVLDVGLTGATRRTDVALADQAGRLATWPAGTVWVAPRADIVNGTVVLMPGDLLPELGHVVHSPVRIEISGGRLVEVHGETTDADVMRCAVEALDLDRAPKVVEVGLGLNLCPPLPGLGLFDPRHLAPGRGVAAAGRTSLAVAGGDGQRLTCTLAATSFEVDQVGLAVAGDLAGALAPDVYELAAR